MTKISRPIFQIMGVSIVGVLLSAALYSDRFQACCMDSVRTEIGVLTTPAILVAMVLGGGVHSATATDFTIGLVIEMLGVWALVRLALKIWRRNAART
jgi:uncharacterized membrane protein